MDFEFLVDHDDSVSGWRRQFFKGRIGDRPPSHDDKVTMLWENGQSKSVHTEMLHCAYDNSTCYEAKTVPVIHDISSTTGYTTGKQILTVKGHGFNSENIVAKAAGQDCIVLEKENTQFTCEV